MLPLNSDEAIEIGHVQCALLLALTRLTAGARTAASRLVKLAVEWLEDLPQPPSNKDTVGRAWLGAFIIDTLAAASTRTKPSITSARIESFLDISDGAEEWQPWRRTPSASLGPAPALLIDTPTHSLSMLVLQAKLLQHLNSALQLGKTDWTLNGVDLRMWSEEVDKRAAKAGFIEALSVDMDHFLTQPPGLVHLRVMCTSLCPQSQRDPSVSLAQDNLTPLGQNEAEQRRSVRLNEANMRRLEADPHAAKHYPALQLLPHLQSQEVRQEVRQENTHSSDEHSQALLPVQHDYSNGDQQALVPDLPPLEASAGFDLNSHAGADYIHDMQQHSSQLLASLNSGNMHEQAIADPANGPGSVPSFDSYAFSIDAPFLDFMDTLDERAT